MEPPFFLNEKIPHLPRPSRDEVPNSMAEFMLVILATYYNLDDPPSNYTPPTKWPRFVGMAL